MSLVRISTVLSFPLLALLLIVCHDDVNAQSPRRRKKPLEKYHVLHNNDNDDNALRRIDIRNMTCDFFEQPLNHFALPRSSNLTYQQRYCVYNGYVEHSANATVLFYTGNESPLEQYINSSGLIFDLAVRLQAQVVFVEHRYEGQSLPDPSIPDCLAYSSSIQALADYANFIELRLFGGASTEDDDADADGSDGALQRRPVIAFGGSYGGMLSAWLRMKYPNVVAGAIAASAPIWGFPRNFPTKIDSAWQVVWRGLKRPYPPTLPENNKINFDSRSSIDDNHCADNLLASWPIIQLLAGTVKGRDLLTQSFRLCSPLKATEGDLLIDWAQSPWFDLAEGSFPYPSTYISFALTHNENAPLPAWPLQSACWRNSSLHQDFGISFRGNLSDVRYQIIVFDDNNDTLIAVDWDNATATPESLDRLVSSDTVAALLTNVRDAVSVWFNVTLDKSCYNLTVAPNTASETVSIPPPPPSPKLRTSFISTNDARDLMQATASSSNSSEVCLEKMREGSWPALCCNEEMNLIITEASGLGRDMFWPPSHSRGTWQYSDTIPKNRSNITDPYCQDPDGFFGYPKDPPDPWSTMYDFYYGGTRIESHSNIVFSNGLLDPWSAAGVYAKGRDPTMPNGLAALKNDAEIVDVPGLYVQNITDSAGLVAVIMEYGGHHTDLMYSSWHDPPCIKAARDIEERFIRKWIQEWREKTID